MERQATLSMSMLVLHGEIALAWMKLLQSLIPRQNLDRGGPRKESAAKTGLYRGTFEHPPSHGDMEHDDSGSGEATNLKALQATGEDIAKLG